MHIEKIEVLSLALTRLGRCLACGCMRVSLLALIVLCCAALVGKCPAQEEKKQTAQQAKELFEKEDRLLNEAWAAAKKALSEADFNELKEEQRAWMEYRDYLARSPLYTGAEAQGELPLDSPEYLEAAAGLSETRTEWLKGLVKKFADETLTGVWTDSYGGRIEIAEKDGHLHFSIVCVRGQSSHVGDLEGIAVWNRPIGWFSDKGKNDTGEQEANLCFVLRNHRLEITGANTSHYHGARAYFDGTYLRVGTLSAERQKELVENSNDEGH